MTTRRAVSGAFLASLTRDEGAAWGPAKSYGPARHEVIGGRNWAMPSARAATPSGPSLLRVSGIAGIAIASAALRSTVSHTVVPWSCRGGGQAKPQGRKLHAATSTLGFGFHPPIPRWFKLYIAVAFVASIGIWFL